MSESDKPYHGMIPPDQAGPGKVWVTGQGWQAPPNPLGSASIRHRVRKRYGHELGLSCCFRQPDAQSHCRLLHGYSLAFDLYFEAIELDSNGWVLDFGCLRPVKQYLTQMYDHTTIIRRDDPALGTFRTMARSDSGWLTPVIDLRVVQAVGMEAFAQSTYQWIECWMKDEKHSPRVRLIRVEVSEHPANTASYGET